MPGIAKKWLNKKMLYSQNELHVVISCDKIPFFRCFSWSKVKPLSSTSQQSLQLQKGEMVQLHLRLQVGISGGWFNDEA